MGCQVIKMWLEYEFVVMKKKRFKIVTKVQIQDLILRVNKSYLFCENPNNYCKLKNNQ
jgi:hypothetical protein